MTKEAQKILFDKLEPILEGWVEEMAEESFWDERVGFTEYFSEELEDLELSKEEYEFIDELIGDLKLEVKASFKTGGE